mgnify:CR=1 FL=1
MTPTFLTLIQMFQLEGMVALGKMLNPGTNQKTKNLDQARHIINMLEVLDKKTANNLTDDERRFLEQTLSTLRLNFVEESQRPSVANSGELT